MKDINDLEQNLATSQQIQELESKLPAVENNSGYGY